ncbi:MAG: hypothetical protein M3Y08_19570 [Fibrobacterota bacterium]|nr:hypothetical protein [Fibrobacterota bacterium]
MRVMAMGAWLAATLLLVGCAASKTASVPKEVARAPMDRILARMVWKGDLDRAKMTADSLFFSKEPAEKEIALYWKAVIWLYRNQPDSALVILDANQGKWTGGLRRVHSSLLLAMARDDSQTRSASHNRHEEAAKSAPDKSMQDRIDALQKETGELRAENARLESEKEKYQKLLKDLDGIH